METILGLLLLVLPVVFKAIEKKLNSSSGKGGRKGAAPVAEDDTTVFPDFSYDLPEETSVMEDAPHVTSTAAVLPDESTVPVLLNSQVHDVAAEEGMPQIHRHAAVRAASVQGRRHAVEPVPSDKPAKRIDPRQLVIYSEIMKPKYQE